MPKSHFNMLDEDKLQQSLPDQVLSLQILVKDLQIELQK